MNKLSKSWQCRPKVTEPKPEKRRAYNSTLAASTKPINKISKKHRATLAMDSVCADEAMSRDGFQCMACKWLWGRNRDATVVHHIQGKNTHFGPERRFRLLYQVSLCEECHHDTESQNGHSRWLDIEAREDGESVGTQIFRQTVNKERREAERPNVTNWNPFEVETE